MAILLYIHVLFSGAALLLGAAALSFQKGSKLHQQSGRLFVFAMLIMGISAAVLAARSNVWMDVLSGLFASYLVLTAWLTMQRPRRDFAIGLIVVGVLLVVGYLSLEWIAIQSGERRADVPPYAALVFGCIAGLAVISDCRLLMGPVLSAGQRLVRHLWRMCFALLMASISFFVSRAHLFPEVVQQSGVLVLLGLAPILCMLFWVGWVRRAAVIERILRAAREARLQ